MSAGLLRPATQQVEPLQLTHDSYELSPSVACLCQGDAQVGQLRHGGAYREQQLLAGVVVVPALLGPAQTS